MEKFIRIGGRKKGEHDLASFLGLNKVMDVINQRWGRGTIGLAAAGTNQQWRMKGDARFPHYTTCWTELPLVRD